MAEKALTDAQAAALYGTTDADGAEVVYPAVTVNNWGPAIIRTLDRILDAARAANSMRVFEVESNADAIGICPGRIRFAGIDYAYAGADPAVDGLTNNDTTYLWAYISGGAVTIASAIDATGWPSYAHVPLAEVTLAAGVITAVLDRRPDTMLANQAVAFSAAAFKTWAIDGDGARTNGGGIVGEVTLTEAAAAYAVVYDDGATEYEPLSTSSNLAGYTANYQLFPDTEVASDAVYFGHTVPFCEIALDISTAGVYSGDALVWEYWDGDSWATLTLAQDNTDTTAADGKRSFQRDGAIHFVPPSDWASTTVNSQAAYWIRARVDSAAITTIPTTNSVEHETVAITDGIIAPATMTITDLRASDLATTLHTATDVKFILMDFTKGTHSGELTWAQDQRIDGWSGLSMDVDAGDSMGILITQEDGTDEITNPMLEIIGHVRG